MIKCKSKNIIDESCESAKYLICSLMYIKIIIYLKEGSELREGDRLTKTCWMLSPNEVFSFIMQDDGNLVLYFEKSNRALVATNTVGSGDQLVIQNGQIILYDRNSSPIWASNNKEKGDRLRLQDDGSLVILDSSSQRQVWVSNTARCKWF